MSTKTINTLKIRECIICLGREISIRKSILIVFMEECYRKTLIKIQTTI